MYDTDVYGAIVNGEGTYEQAAFDLSERGHVALNWTDGRGTLLNILFSWGATRVGSPGGIVDSSGPKMWVGVAGHGFTGFSLGSEALTTYYIAEKLGFKNVVTGTAAAELISNVRQQLTAIEFQEA